MKTRFFIIATVLAMAPAAWAVNLIEVYKQALSSDPTFKAANSQWLADRETLSIKRGALLPQLSANGSIARSHNDTSSASSILPIASQKHFYNNQVQYSLQLTQPLFHFGDWASVWQAQAIAKQAEVTFLAAAEDLLLRTSKAYFGVLQSRDVLHFARANREALGSTLNQAKHKYDVGLIAIVDLENARADYDRAISDEIAADNDLSDKLEQLNEITGVRYIYLNPIKASFPLLLPQPFDSEKWVKAAEQQNFDLAAARYATIVTRENIKIQNAGHLPTLDATGSYTYNSNSNPGNALAFSHDKIASVGLGLNLPLFQGGRVLSATRQANYQYQKAIADQETKYRSTVSLTRQAYLGVISNVSEIKANRQAIKSAQSSLRATKAGYEAGTRTMVDVLNAQAKLYESQKDFAVSEYNYIIQLLTLKQLTGILDASDLRQINTWLEIPECDKCIPDKNHKKHHKSVKKTRTHKKEAPANKSDFTKSIIESPIVAVDPDKEKQLDITNIGSDLKP